MTDDIVVLRPIRVDVPGEIRTTAGVWTLIRSLAFHNRFRVPADNRVTPSKGGLMAHALTRGPFTVTDVTVKNIIDQLVSMLKKGSGLRVTEQIT